MSAPGPTAAALLSRPGPGSRVWSRIARWARAPVNRALVLALSGTVAVLGGGSALASAEYRPALVFGINADSNHNSFYEAVMRGARRFAARNELGIQVYFVTDHSGWIEPLERAAEGGHDPVIAVGPLFSKPVTRVAERHPDTRFTVIDSVAEGANVRSVTFREQEGAYLVGVLAAMASERGHVGFVGGMRSPVISRFECGFSAGARHVDPRITVSSALIGDEPNAWNQPALGAEVARDLMQEGADVIFQAAGGSGIGVIHTVANAGQLVIGVDINQNGLRPGSVLTSMVKRIDVATYRELREAQLGQWRRGHRELGLAEDALGWAHDDNNALLIDQAMFDEVERARRDIIRGAPLAGAGGVTVSEACRDTSAP